MEGKRRFVLLSVLLLAVSACSLGPGREEAKFGEDIVVGIPLSFTGNLKSEGAMAQQGYQLWQDWVNGKHGGLKVRGVRHRVQLKYRDDQSKPDLAAQLAQQLITEDKAKFLLGPYGTANTAAVAAVAERNRVPMISANGSARAIFTKGYQYVFGVQTPADRQLQSMLDMTTRLNPKPTKIAILSSDDGFSKEVAQGVVDYAPTKGLTVAFNQTYPDGSTNLFGLLSQAKAVNPDMVINSGHLIEAIALNKAARDMRFEAKMFAYTVGPAMPDFRTQLGKEADFVFTGAQWTARAKYKPSYYLSLAQYVDSYRKRFNTQEEPNYQVADATAAGLALERSIESADSLEPDKVRSALRRMDFTCFFGRIRFDETGQNSTKPMLVEQLQGGLRQTVWPPDLANSEPMYPTPSWTARAGLPPVAEQPQQKLPATGGGPRRR